MINTQTMIAEFTPMLAHKRNPEKLDVTKGAYLQPKLDGIRCIAKLVNGQVKLFSRNNKEFKNAKHIISWITPFFKSNPNVILDGEFYNHGFKAEFEKIVSLVRKTKPTEADVLESMLNLEYHVFDCYHIDNPSMPFDERYRFLTTKLSHGLSVRRVETYYIKSDADLNAFEKEFLNEGFEGAMLRDNSPYKQGRSWGLQKIKKWYDTEFIITGFVEGKGKFEGGLGKFIGFDDIGREVEIPYPNATMAERKKIWEERREKWLGKQATFIYFERTKAGAYRFPKFKSIRNYE